MRNFLITYKKSLLIILVILIISSGVTAYFIMTKPVAGHAKPEQRTELVETMTLSQKTCHTEVPALGIVQSAQTVTIQPEVSGRVIWVSPALQPGGTFQKGEPLFKIDPRDYNYALSQAEATQAEKESDYQVEVGEHRVVKEDWNRTKSDQDRAGADRDLVLRKPQLKAAAVALEAAKSAVDKAKRDVERTVISAPFACAVLSESVDVGQTVTTSTTAAELSGTDQFHIQVSVAVEMLPMIRLPENGTDGATVKIIVDTGIKQTSYPGKVLRLLADADPNGRLARLLIGTTGKSEEKGAPPLLINTTVAVEIEGLDVPDSWRIPRKAVHNSKCVWVMTTQKKLAERTLTVAFREPDTLIAIGGFEPGDKLITSRMPAPVIGMALREMTDESTDAAEETEKTDVQDAPANVTTEASK